MDSIKLFCVYDSKVEGYLPPFTAMNRAVATRIFETAVMQEGHDFNQHAEDYSLFEIGEYEPDTAELKALTPVSTIVNAHHIISKYANRQEDHARGI